MKYAALLALAACLATPALAQRAGPWNAPHTLHFGADAAIATPDTTKPWRYFPMHVGDEWEYEDGDGWIEHRRIVREATFHGRTYFRWENRVYRTDSSVAASYHNYLRYDSTTNRVRIGGSSSELEVELFDAPCHFDAEFDTLADCQSIRYFVRGRYDAALVFGSGPGRGTDTVRTSVKAFDGTVSYRYAAGIGLVYSEVEGFGKGLYYYRVGGVEHGRRRILVANDPGEGASAEGLVIEAVYPNPARDRLMLDVVTTRPGRWRVEAYDVLGRRALSHEGGGAAGAHAVALDVSALPAGVYAVRFITAEGVSGARSVVVRR